MAMSMWFTYIHLERRLRDDAVLLGDNLMMNAASMVKVLPHKASV